MEFITREIEHWNLYNENIEENKRFYMIYNDGEVVSTYPICLEVLPHPIYKYNVSFQCKYGQFLVMHDKQLAISLGQCLKNKILNGDVELQKKEIKFCV
jgi:hypothetical protein